MGNKHKAKGTSFETVVVNYLREKGFKNARRTALAGSNDTGDINGVVREKSMSEVAFQCKNQKSFSLSEWLDDTVAQAGRLRDGLPVLVVKRPRKGVAALGESYAVMRLDDVVRLLKDADFS
jgi:Holliday junction resolvase